MRPELELLELIDKYLSGKLSPSDSIAFKQNIANDPELASKVNAIKVANLLVVENRMTSVRKLSEGKNRLYKYGGTLKLLSAIGIIALLGLMTFVSVNNSERSEDSPKTNTVQPGKVTTETNSSFSKIEKPEVTLSDKDKSEKSSGSLVKKDEEKNGTENQEALKINSEVPIDETVLLKSKMTEEDKVLIVPTKKLLKTIDSCENNKYDIHVETSPTCKGESVGQIFISKVSGGRQPWSYSIDGFKFKSGTSFQNLEHRKYKITLKDASGCSHQFKDDYEVAEKVCAVSREYVFHPQLQGIWQFPTNGKQNFTVRIINSAGLIIYETKSQNGSNDSWNGICLNGLPALPDLYIFEIEFADGTREQGHLTIVM